MQRGDRGGWWLAAMLGAACGTPESSGPGDGTTIGIGSTGTTASTGLDESSTFPPLIDLGDGPPPGQTSDCADYVACAQTLMLADAATIEQTYGPEAACWETDEQAAACDDACEQELAAILVQLEADGEPVPEVCDPPEPITWSEISMMISDSCVDGCHEPGGLDVSLDFSGNAYLSLYQVNSEQSSLYLVDPGSHEDSYLWHKLSGSQGSAGGMGSRMPQDAEPWPQELIDGVAAWIDEGASNF